jgi:hypothetical protein
VFIFYYYPSIYSLFFPPIIGIFISGLYSILTKQSYFFATPHVWGPNMVYGERAVKRGIALLMHAFLLFFIWYWLYS